MTKNNDLKIDAPNEIAFDVYKLQGGLKSTLEAILLVCCEPQNPSVLASTLAVSEEKILQTLEELKIEYETDLRGFTLNNNDGLWRFCSRPEYGEVITAHIKGSSSQKLSIAALETLAIIAYQSPISRADIANIRGVNVDGVIRTLLQRDLIEESPKKSPNGATLYQTTNLFLDKIGISSLDELEPLAPFLPNLDEDLSELEEKRNIALKNKSKKHDDSADINAEVDDE